MDPVLFYKCLADDTRLRCMLLIHSQQELCVCELVEAMQMSQPKISRHLAQLRQCGLLSDRRQGQWVFYSLNEGLPNWARQVIAQTAEGQGDFFGSDLEKLAQMKSRPERQTCSEE
ncbi:MULTISPECIES: metalloregulator ArsR/SmtB family transcription factor [unclassified Vibrio]|uniref:Metalloregulator ArsR/SmtB family transcription factor n=1 Tax=Vibrio sp. HB236076 TaxID=3232307 RepID=A0AB39HKI2_9VIBR|nr:metalloregulator ArsR/SmtB family transcription factor [Vibrio sp. HB161653]MDP5253068.1 metalloregulator ArsR/SmtB family transcription factor [Vibrio sp. HB161653]